MAGVGIASVSRVLTGQGDTSPSMQRRVLKAAEELGYVPNVLARELRRKTSFTVGFVASDIANPLVAEIFRGAEAALAAAGYSMLLTDSNDTPRADGERIRVVRQRQVEGILILPVTEDDPLLLSELRDLGAPIVAIDRELPPNIPASFAQTDHGAGIYAATQHLLGLGHRRLALVTGRNVRPARERFKAMERAIQDGGGAASLLVHPGNLSEAHGALALAELLSLPDRPTGVILGGNQLLTGALLYLRKHHVLLGQDISLISCDDDRIGQLNDPPVATVMRDVSQLGRIAAELLLERLQAEDVPPRTVLLPTWFLAKESCGDAPRQPSDRAS